jgi:hypothetical protein
MRLLHSVRNDILYCVIARNEVTWQSHDCVIATARAMSLYPFSSIGYVSLHRIQRDRHIIEPVIMNALPLYCQKSFYPL